MIDDFHLKYIKSVYSTHIMMMISSVWRALCDCISSSNTVYQFVETTNVPDLSEVSPFCCYALQFVLCTRFEMTHKSQMHR